MRNEIFGLGCGWIGRKDFIPEPPIRHISLVLTYFVRMLEGIGLPRDVAGKRVTSRANVGCCYLYAEQSREHMRNYILKQNCAWVL
jgi:hypothetical protein